MRLNRYVAHAGICSRRKADEYIQAGFVKVDEIVVKEMGYRVEKEQVVKFKDEIIRPIRNKVYVLLNKPKNIITTTSDPEGRRTVLDLVEKASKERLFPVGRLDRNTTGLILLTNDGELAQKLTHPSFLVKKIYHVFLDKNFAKKDFNAILKGVKLEDGLVIVDDLSYVDHDKKQIGIEIHIGRNRIVRRLFEALGYQVLRLDRVVYASLTKKNITRGRWRYLNDREIRTLRKD